MESQSQYVGSNSGMDGVDQKEGKVANQRKTGTCCESILRILAFMLTVTAAVVLGVSKQTEMKILPTLPPIDLPATAKWHYLSAFVYFVVANAIACAYAAFSLVLSFANRGTKSGLGLVIILLDLLMVALLFSCNGAAAAIGLMRYQLIGTNLGNSDAEIGSHSHVQWNKVCNVFGRFCNHAAAAIVLSMLGSLAFMYLVVLAALGLHRRSK